ncbi:MAG: HAMP domain-containing histidine kinase [Streptococcaceae bacterium]|nr:HAMP domain-containing histidine kinase [Streptococcaceae bacterium]
MSIKSKVGIASTITRSFVHLFLGILVLSVVVVSSVVAFQSLQAREAQGTALISAVGEAAQDGNINWREFELTDTGDGSWANFMRVTSSDGSVDESHGTTDFLASHKARLDHFYVVGGSVFWESSSVIQGNKIQLWLSLSTVLHTLKVTILAILFVMALIFIGGLFWIRRAANRVAKPVEAFSDWVAHNDGKPIKADSDVSEIAVLTQNFNALLARLDAKMAAEKQFVSDASHELRTPIAAIRGHVSLLKRRGREHPELLWESLDFIDSESLRMKILTENLLTLSREQMALSNLTEIRLTDVAQKAVKVVQQSLTQTVKFDENPEENFDEKIKTDPNVLIQILSIFLENAGKYAPADSEILVHVGTREISVNDRGPGISGVDKVRIFDRFTRVDPSRNSAIPGNGLGLAISRQLADKIKAIVFVRDNPAGGSSFVVKFDENKN